MKKLTPIELKSWALPLIVAALVFPVVVASLTVGSAGTFIAGAAMVAIVVVIAARSQFDEPIEVPRPRDGRYHVLAVALSPIDEPATVEEILAAAERGERALGTDAAGEPEVLVVAPAQLGVLDRWATDLGDARDAAQRRLAVSMGALAAARLDARGEVGDHDPVQAVEDSLRSFPAHEVIFVAPAGVGEPQVEEVRRRLDRPVRRLTAG